MPFVSSSHRPLRISWKKPINNVVYKLKQKQNMDPSNWIEKKIVKYVYKLVCTNWLTNLVWCSLFTWELKYFAKYSVCSRLFKEFLCFKSSKFTGHQKDLNPKCVTLTRDIQVRTNTSDFVESWWMLQQCMEFVITHFFKFKDSQAKHSNIYIRLHEWVLGFHFAEFLTDLWLGLDLTVETGL